MNRLLELFMNGIRNEYEPAIDSVPWDSSEGGWQIPFTDTWDLVRGVGEGVLVGDQLLDEVIQSVCDEAWVEKDWLTRRRDVVLTEAWEAFASTVKFDTRYMIWLRPDLKDLDLGAGEISPAEILLKIGELINELGLVKDLAAGTSLWRTRRGQIVPSASELGTAQPNVARQANRMSPAGIPLFYGATDMETAILEVLGTSDELATSGRFELSASMRVVDLSVLPAIPTMFRPDLGRLRRQLIFLHVRPQVLHCCVDVSKFEVRECPHLGTVVEGEPVADQLCVSSWRAALQPRAGTSVGDDRRARTISTSSRHLRLTQRRRHQRHAPGNDGVTGRTGPARVGLTPTEPLPTLSSAILRCHTLARHNRAESPLETRRSVSPKRL